jgi:HAD superfamily hydrolase (TIGR01450 family)
VRRRGCERSGIVVTAMTSHGPPAPAGSANADDRALGAVRALAFDLDGTIYLGQDLLPGARALIEALQAEGVPYLFATNNSSKTATQYLRHLRGLGIPVERSAIVTSNDVARAVLAQEGRLRPYLLATPEVTEEYREAGFEPADGDADGVLLTFDTTLTYAKLRRASDLLRDGAPYHATHPDLVCPTPEGPIPDCGAFIELLAAATGRRPTVLGKPERPMADTIRGRLHEDAHRIAFVGDRLYTDVRMANEHGFRAVLTLTGEATAADLTASPYRPDLVVTTMLDLHRRLHATGTLRSRPTEP